MTQELVAIYVCREGEGDSFKVKLDLADDPPADAIRCMIHPEDISDWAMLVNIVLVEANQAEN